MEDKTNVFFSIHGHLKREYFIQFSEIISTEPLLSLYGNIPVKIPVGFERLGKMDKYDFVYQSIKEFLRSDKHPVLFENLNKQVVSQYGIDDILILGNE